MSNTATWVGVGISAVSVGVAVLAFFKSSKAQKIANGVQKHLLHIEQGREKDRVKSTKKANLSASIESDWSSGGKANPRLSIMNTGPVEARNVVAKIDGKDISEHTLVTNGTTDFLIGPNSPYKCSLAISSGGNTPTFDFEITWEDASGEPGFFQTKLTF